MTASPPDPDVLLQGDVLHIGFHRVGKAPYPEDIVTPGVLRALAQHLNVDLQTDGVFWGDYCYFAAITGEAFRFLDFMGLSQPDSRCPLVERYGHATAEDMWRHAFQAAGLTADLHLRPQLPAKDHLRDALVQSLRDRQWPAIGIGVFGPPEPFLITGYAEDGEVLLGWSHFQGDKQDDPNVSFEPTGQFRLRNWYDSVDGIALITTTGDRPEPRGIYQDALERAIPELETTGDDGHVLGTAAMDAWAGFLERDEGFAGWTDSQWQKAQSDHGGTAGDLAERRALAGSFLDLASRFLPEAAGDLAMASTAFRGSHDTVYEIWETAAKTGPFDPDVEKFKDPDCRRTMAGLVRRLAQFDRRGLAFMKRAADTVRGCAPGPPLSADPVLDGMAVLEKAPQSPTAGSAWTPENVALPNVLGMARAWLGEPFGDLGAAEQAEEKLDYCLWMGLSGAAFAMPSDGPERANLELVFDALGCDYELWVSKSLADDTGLPCRLWGWDDNLRRRIFWNLRDNRLPVMLFHCGPWPDWWLITGAERWNTFSGYGGSGPEPCRPGGPLDHPSNPLRHIDLFDGFQGDQTWVINLLSRRTTPKPPLQDLYQRAIAWGAQAMARQRMELLAPGGSEHLSDQPYHDWATIVTSDALFPPDDLAVLEQRSAWLQRQEMELSERRLHGSRFLELAAIRLNRPELTQAAGHFRAVHTHVTRMWAHRGGLRAPDAHRRLADRGVRQAIAQHLQQIEHEDAAAAALLNPQADTTVT